MRVDEIRQLVIAELLSPPKSRKFSREKHPDPAAKSNQFFSECISTIVRETLEAQGYYKVDGAAPTRGTIVFGRLTDNKSPHYIRIRWDTGTDLFNPIDGITEVDSPTFGEEYIEKHYHPSPPDSAEAERSSGQSSSAD